jgi:hypothetical protein
MSALRWHLAQLNIGRVRAPMTDPLMAGFVTELESVNALADSAPGFVWRLQTEAGDATAIRPYGDDRILINMSVWETVEALKAFVYRTHHADVMQQRNCRNRPPGQTKPSILHKPLASFAFRSRNNHYAIANR